MNGSGRPGDVISFELWEGGPGAAIWQRGKSGGGHGRNYATVLEALDYMAELLTGPRCKECGGPIDHGWAKDFEEKIATLGLCFNCVAWTENLEEDGPDTLYVDGHRYSIIPDDPHAHFQGHGGARFHIRFFDGRDVISRNVWHQGEVPACFRGRRPDNAEFVKDAGR